MTAIDPTGKFLIAANADSNNLVTFKIDETTGALTPTGKEVSVPSPQCIAFADEESVVQTRFATTELALLRAHLGVDIEPSARAAERVLAEPVPAALLDARQFTFLGTGWTYGLANEAALKLREAAGLWTEAYPAMEYRHGPAAVTGERSVVWLFGSPPDGLAGEIAAAGGTAWIGEEDPLAELVRVQMVAVAAARARGLDPDRPRNLARSVILGSP